jgi:cation diffusion facilitator family transporter
MAEAHADRGAARSSAIRRVFLGLLIANLVVVAVKVAIGIRADSLSVLGDALHASVDALNNLVFIALTALAAQAPDEEHPYGHGKFEVVGALGIVIFLSVSCFELLKGVAGRLLAGDVVPTLTRVDLAMLGVTLGVNVWVAWYETRKGRELDSPLLLADSAHTRGDVFITLGVIAGGFLSRAGWFLADPIIALIVTALVARIGYQIVRGALPILVDERARSTDAIRQAAETVDGVRSAYSIRSRSSAGMKFAELTIGVPGSLEVARAHVIADAVEERLRTDLNLDQVVVHIEPC